MKPKQKQLVQETWKQVAPIAETAAELFYGRLFELDPSLRALFARTDMKAQQKILMQTLGLIVKGLDMPEQMIPALENLGRRHVRYGVQESHFATVGEALLWTLGKGLGPAFTPPVKEAWGAAFGVVASVMKAGMQQKAA